MGRHSMGLKDAVAILFRHGHSIELTAQGQPVDFKVTDRGLVLYRMPSRAAAEASSTWRVQIVGVSNAENEVKHVKSHFVEFFEPKLELLHEGTTRDGVPIRVYKPNGNKKAKKGPRFVGPGGKAGMFVGRRFVQFPDNCGLTALGYHVTNPTTEMKKLIDRNQTITNIGSNRSKPIQDALRDVFRDDALIRAVVAALPGGAVRELLSMIPDAWSGGAAAQGGGGGGGGGGGAGKGVSQGGSSAHAHVDGQDREVRLCVLAVKNAVDRAGEAARSQWKNHGVELLNELNLVARTAFQAQSVQVVPYGSMVYEVCTPAFHRHRCRYCCCARCRDTRANPRTVPSPVHICSRTKVATNSSDVDVTLFVYDGDAVHDVRALLKTFGDALTTAGFRVTSCLEARVPVLNVQKDAPAGVPFHVDISVNNHSAVHKSHALRDLFAGTPGSSDLALLVKMWIRSCGFADTRSHYLSSHGWMLLVAQFCAEVRGPASEVDFFKWFVKEYPVDRQWTIGARTPPCEFEPDNVATHVGLDQKRKIAGAAQSAIENLALEQVPWAPKKK
jgi:hypothetical protein